MRPVEHRRVRMQHKGYLSADGRVTLSADAETVYVLGYGDDPYDIGCVVLAGTWYAVPVRGGDTLEGATRRDVIASALAAAGGS